MNVSRWIGWVGFAIVLLAYAGVSFGFITATSVAYGLANAFGAVFLGVVSWRKKAWQPFTIYVVWTGIALIGLL